MKKAFTSKKSNHVNFFYIPENESSIKSIRIPVWGPKVLAGLLGALIIYSSFSAYALNNLNDKYEASLKNIEELTKINNRQKIEIQNLNLNAERIQEQLDENIAALEEIKAAVGLKSEASEENEKAKTSDNISQISISNTYSTQAILDNYDLSDEISTLKTSLISLSKQTLSQKTEIDESIVSINDRLDYLRCVPSIVPVVAKITCGYGYRKNPFTSRGSEFHYGVDFGAPYGTKVVATGDGVVLFAGYQAGYGRMVVISHGYGFTTCYAHNSSLLVKKGDKVKRGQAIARVGNTGRSTGTHLHYEVKINGKNVNPAKYF
ncbi:peptidoglycan DD-metalloendopeptidase family protein [Lutispora sp.]|uniref:peptidoglycan DD-metalloendopeptidase family protein n=1 Tax=Lutispora sp. TaxID=2828727 RepID=UPI003564F98C